MPYSKWFRELAVASFGLMCRYGDDKGDCMSVGTSHEIQLHSKSGLHITELSDAQFLCTKHHQGGVHIVKKVKLQSEGSVNAGDYDEFMESVAFKVDVLLLSKKGLRKKLEVVRRRVVNGNHANAEDLCAKRMIDDVDLLNFCDKSSSIHADIWEGTKSKVYWKGCSCCKRLFIVSGNMVRRKRWICGECVGEVVKKRGNYEGLDVLAIHKLLDVAGKSVSSWGVEHEMSRRKKRTAYHATKDYVKRRLKSNPAICVELSNLNLRSVYRFFKTHSDFLPEAACFTSEGRLRVNKLTGADSGGMDVSTVRDYARKLVDEWRVKFPKCFSKDGKSVVINVDLLKEAVISYHEPVSESQKLYHERRYAAQKPIRQYVNDLKTSNPEEYKRLQIKAGIAKT